jgi:hypothetical protein
MAEDHPAYEWTRPLRDSIDIESETARRWRELHAADTDHPPVGATEDQRRNQLTSALREAADAVDKWWRVVFWLSVDPNGRLGEPLFSHDLSARPGWTLLDAEQQRQVVDIGLDYVADHRPTPGRWLGAETVTTDDAMPDWAGVYLLTTLAQYEPERLAVLDLDAWRRWAPAITAAWNFDREVDTDPPVHAGRASAAQSPRSDQYGRR